MSRTYLRRVLALTTLLTAACSDTQRDEITAPSGARPARDAEQSVVMADSTVSSFGEQGSIAPRLGIASNPLATPGVATYACDAFGTSWVNDWKTALLGKTKYRAAAYLHFQGGTYTTYPGAHIYNGTNTNSDTYLGACNGDASHVLVVKIQRRISGVWKPVATVNLVGYQKYTFHSFIPASYRMQTKSANASPVAHYGIAAGWDITPGLALSGQ